MFKIAMFASVSVLAAVTAAQALSGLSAHGVSRAEAAPLVAMAVTDPQPVAPARAARINKSADGHYWADARVNGSKVKFLVDTGATAVALKDADARRLGVNSSTLTYDYEVTTAAGPARAARVVLASIAVDGVRVNNVEAFVIDRGLDTSLLGMSYLGRLSGFEATSSALILNP